MAILSSIVQRIGYLVLGEGTVAVSEFSLAGMWPSSATPVVQCAMIVSSLALLYHLYKQERERTEEVSDVTNSSDKGEDASYESLAWLNKLIAWMSVTAATETHSPAVSEWLERVNSHLADQQNDYGACVYGFREGTVAPWVQKIDKVERDGPQLRMTVMLETSEFGFLVTVQEKAESSVVSSSYSLVVRKFRCKFTVAVKRNETGGVSAQMSADERKPLVRVEMKPLTRRRITNTLPEVVAESVLDAVLATSFRLDLHTSPSNICHDVIDPVGIEPPVSLRKRGANRVKQLVTRHSVDYSVTSSVASSPIGTPVGSLQRNGDELGGSLGSLSSLTRNPSGRGPAKPIRVREKRLHVKLLWIDGILAEASPTSTTYTFQLDSPPQRKVMTSTSRSLNFDLSSRSSLLKFEAVLRNTCDGDNSNKESLVTAQTTIWLESVDMTKRSQVVLTLTRADDQVEVAKVNLEFAVSENGQKSTTTAVDPAERNAKLPKRKSFPNPGYAENDTAGTCSTTGSDITTGQSTAGSDVTTCHSNTESDGTTGSDIGQRSRDGEKPNLNGTRVTMVTSRTSRPSVTNSPTSPHTNADNCSQNHLDKVGVRYSEATVAESALRDLATQRKLNSDAKKLSKTRIVITTVEDKSVSPPQSPSYDATESSMTSSSDDQGQTPTTTAADDTSKEPIQKNDVNRDKSDVTLSEKNEIKLREKNDVTLREKQDVITRETHDAIPREKHDVIFREKKDVAQEDKRMSPHVRRAKSLVLRNSEDEKSPSDRRRHHHRPSTSSVEGGSETEAAAMTSYPVENRLKPKHKKTGGGSLTRLFSRKNKKTKGSADEQLAVVSESGVAVDSPEPARLKRSRSFRAVFGGKKKHAAKTT